MAFKSYLRDLIIEDYCLSKGKVPAFCCGIELGTSLLGDQLGFMSHRSQK